MDTVALPPPPVIARAIATRRVPDRRQRCDVPRDRALHLIDLENLAGDPRPARRDALALIPIYLELARWRTGDHVVVATNGWLLRQIAFDLPTGWQLRCANGPDGADRALLEVADPRHVAARYHRLVVGSGDGIFTDLVATVAASGIDTALVSRPSGLSRRLRSVAHAVRFVPAAQRQAA